MVYALGESLLDIIVSSMDDVVIRPGGAMLNTSISLGRSQIEVWLITELGDDDTSKLITSFLQDNNVKTGYISQYKNNNTSLALAFLDDKKKPKYTFIKKYPDERRFANQPNFTKNDILLFGSLYSIDKKIRKQLSLLISSANTNKSLIIYDPNIRNAHHLEDEELMNSIIENIEISNIIKGSDEDFTNIFGNSNTEYQLEEIRKINKEALIIITKGADGIIANINEKQIELASIKTNIVSTIGAGDAFNAGIIKAIVSLDLRSNLEIYNSLETILQSGLEFSSQVCSSMDNYINP